MVTGLLLVTNRFLLGAGHLLGLLSLWGEHVGCGLLLLGLRCHGSLLGLLVARDLLGLLGILDGLHVRLLHWLLWLSWRLLLVEMHRGLGLTDNAVAMDAVAMTTEHIGSRGWLIEHLTTSWRV